MIPIQIDGQQFALSFSHTKFDHTKIKTLRGEGERAQIVEIIPRRRRDTACRIVRLTTVVSDGINVTGYDTIASGKSSCSPDPDPITGKYDNFCKETGRVKALEDAIRRAKKSTDPLFNVHDEASAKRFQAIEDQIWGQYLNRFSVRQHYKEIAA